MAQTSPSASSLDRSLTAAPPDSRSTGDLLHGASRLWLGAPAPGLQVRLFRRRINCEAPAVDVEMRIAAVAHYHLWVNGHYVTRGPTFHHVGQLPVARLDLTDRWRAGDNVIAVLVFTAGFPTHNTPAGEPGLWAVVDVHETSGRTQKVVSDKTWLAMDRVGWREHAVRHGYAIGPVEVLDATSHPWGWQSLVYDDTAWEQAEDVGTIYTHDPTPIELDLPPMRFGWSQAQELVGVWAVGSHPAPLEPRQPCEVLGEWLQNEPWQTLPENRSPQVYWDHAASQLAVRGLTEDQGLAVVFDLGREQVGDIIFECDSDSPGLIEMGWSEVMRESRPEIVHKGTSYVNRILVRAGWQRWESLQFTGLRYLVLILRGFSGSMRISRVGVRTSTSAPRQLARFTSSDSKLDAIWGLCTRTLTLCTQEAIIDCPSREQAPYLGDGHLVGHWLATFSGDYRHWRYLFELAFGSQADDGLLRDAPLFPAHRGLIDYTLITVMAMRDYVAMTGELKLGRKLLPGCRRAISYFDRWLDRDSLLQAKHVPGMRHVQWDTIGPPRRTASLDPHLFIDHPGGGGHNLGEPGIERRGRNAALHAFYVLALEALADLEQRVGRRDESLRRREMAEQVRVAAGEAFWDGRRGVFVDAVGDGGWMSEQISEQTNVLALMADFPLPISPDALIRRITAPDPHIARCGPYFYAYLLPLMCRYGMHAEALAVVRRKWGRMLDAGATSLWETFAGDSMDTWCHAWSAAPAPFFIHDILGLRLGERSDPHQAAITLRPRYDLLPRARGCLPTPLGPVCLEWDTAGSKVYLSGSHPNDLVTILYPCDDGDPSKVASPWQLELPSPRSRSDVPLADRCREKVRSINESA